jgi:large subunit ribosomal protein L3
MIAGVWGKKIGMTQVFDGDRVVPVTAINVDCWVVLGSKTVEQDGYSALRVGCIKDRYLEQKFSKDWIKQSKKYFSFVREIKIDQPLDGVAIGDNVNTIAALAIGDKVDAIGVTKGCGFAGVVKRHGFTGAPASHGATMGKAPGSMSGARTKGKVIKGKRLPGHMGMQRRTVRGLKVVKTVEAPNAVVLIKGSIPGKGGTLVFLRKMS